MRHMGFGKAAGFGAKGMAAKGGIFKGIFGFIGGIFKLMFFGFFIIIFLIVAAVFYFFMKKRMKDFQNRGFDTYADNSRNYPKKEKNDDIIDVEIIEDKPTRR